MGTIISLWFSKNLEDEDTLKEHNSFFEQSTTNISTLDPTCEEFRKIAGLLTSTINKSSYETIR